MRRGAPDPAFWPRLRCVHSRPLIRPRVVTFRAKPIRLVRFDATAAKQELSGHRVTLGFRARVPVYDAEHFLAAAPGQHGFLRAIDGPFSPARCLDARSPGLGSFFSLGCVGGSAERASGGRLRAPADASLDCLHRGAHHHGDETVHELVLSRLCQARKLQCF